MKGFVHQPVTGQNIDRVPTGIVDSLGNRVKVANRTPTAKAQEPRGKPSTRLAAAHGALEIFEKDVHKYGATPGC